MLLKDLRERHPRFTYRSYDFARDGENIRIRFDFHLEPNIYFSPEILLPVTPDVDLAALEGLVFHLGLIETASYWKSACSPILAVQAGALSTSQRAWWHDLLMHGMGEFYYRNDIAFWENGFLTITSAEPVSSPAPLKVNGEGSLVMVGGGKDSSLTLELLKNIEGRKVAFALNPTRSALDSARLAGYEETLIIRRSIDPGLLELNKSGYLNGHTPFSAYLAFLGTLAAAANSMSEVIASNETSANEPNLTLHGMPINHQYSKSVRFERLFRQYSREYLSPDISYFSFLRPLHDIQISRLFSEYREQLRSFRSCNVHQKLDSWCTTCPKCAFVYLTLAPFISDESLVEIFGADLFDLPQAQAHIRDLVGLGERKPFECVGTVEESVLAVELTRKRQLGEGKTVHPFVSGLAEELEQKSGDCRGEDRLLKHWDDEHFLTPSYEEALRSALAGILD